MINDRDTIPRTTTRVLGRRVSAARSGSGPPMMFVHGNVGYSYMWRNIIPYLQRSHLCIAPDLPGMGGSDPILPSGVSSYSFDSQLLHVETYLEELDLGEPAVLVGHELGAAMAVQIARKNPSMVKGIILIEGVLRVSNGATFARQPLEIITATRAEGGEKLVLEANFLIERYLQLLTQRRLTGAEMDAYRAPYKRVGESRRPMLSMIRQLPIKDHPGPIDALVEESRLWCAQSPIPKLVIGGNPGFLVPPSILGTTARWAGTQVASVKGRHFLTEDSPARLTSLILDWLAQIGHSR